MIPSADYGALRCFAAVADALSFARAAEALGISSSALSQTVRALEERVGVRLLNRSTRSVSLTPAGAAFLARARPALDTLVKAFHDARRTDGLPAGLVRVHAFHRAAEAHIAPMLASFQRNYPRVVVDLTLDDEVVDLVAAGFDVGVRLGEVIERDMVALRLGGPIRQVTVASPCYVTECGMPETPAELLRHRCIVWRWPGRTTAYAWEFCDEGRWFSIAVQGPLVVNNRDFAIRAAVDGIGIAFAEEDQVASQIAQGRLLVLLRRWSAPFEGFYLCFPRQRHMAPAVRAFVDAMREAARRRSGDPTSPPS